MLRPLRSVLPALVLLACEAPRPPSDVYGNTAVPDPVEGAVVSVDGGVGPLSCPLQAPQTSEPTGAALDPTGFGCFGGCGPACMAECENQLFTVARDVVQADGTTACVRCAYQLLECKSHAFCRWHDDCYRQCDLRWADARGGEPPNIPLNGCYRSCDVPALQRGRDCAVDWAQVTDPSVQLRDACWDGSTVPFTRLVSQPAVSSGACGDDGDHPARPWDPAAAAWDDDVRPPATLPRGGSCAADTDCPDRNQRCDRAQPDLARLNGPGTCVDKFPATGVPVHPWVPEGLSGPGLLRGTGAACALDHQCRSGRCKRGRCGGG